MPAGLRRKGLPLFAMVTPADVTDRDAAKEVLFRLRLMHPEIAMVRADPACAGQLVGWAKAYLNLTVKTVGRPKNAKGFVVLPRRSDGAGSTDHPRLPPPRPSNLLRTAPIRLFDF